MAASLRRAGDALHVFDVRADVAQRFAAEGGIACETLAELASASEVVVSMLVNATQTEDVLFGANGCANDLRTGRGR